MSMDWIHLGISGFTKEDTIDESHRFIYDTGTSRVCNAFKWHSHKNVTKFPMNLWQDCSFLTVKSWFACVFWHWIALVHQSQAALSSNLNMRKWSKFHGRKSSPKLESVFGPLQLYLFALAVTGLNCWTGQDVSRSWMVCKRRHGALDKKEATRIWQCGAVRCQSSDHKVLEYPHAS